MTPWKAILAALMIFLTGAVSGGMGMQIYLNHTAHSPPVRLPPMAMRLQFLHRLSAKLGLTQEQSERIDQIVREGQQRIQKLYEPVSSTAEEEMRSIHRHIEAELTPDQRKQFNELLRERRSQRPWLRRDGGNPSGPGPKGQPTNPTSYFAPPPPPTLPSPRDAEAAPKPF